MSKIINSIYNIGQLDDFARKDTIIHRIHPLIKLITTVFYLVVVVSFSRYEINKLIPFMLYPIIIFILSELPIIGILKKVLIVLPFILGIGIINLFFDNEVLVLGSIKISAGTITFISIIIKGILTVIASILLIATTGIENLAAALRTIKVPKIFVIQLLLTYRYISILIEEVYTMSTAYSLRAPNEKGIHPRVWGSFLGQLLIRTFDRAQRVYEAMNLRGFNGEYNTGKNIRIKIKDLEYLICWISFFIIARSINIPLLIERVFSGVIK